jgi:hypothetical protein
MSDGRVMQWKLSVLDVLSGIELHELQMVRQP